MNLKVGFTKVDEHLELGSSIVELTIGLAVFGVGLFTLYSSGIINLSSYDSTISGVLDNFQTSAPPLLVQNGDSSITYRTDGSVGLSLQNTAAAADEALDSVADKDFSNVGSCVAALSVSSSACALQGVAGIMVFDARSADGSACNIPGGHPCLAKVYDETVSCSRPIFSICTALNFVRNGNSLTQVALALPIIDQGSSGVIPPPVATPTPSGGSGPGARRSGHGSAGGSGSTGGASHPGSGTSSNPTGGSSSGTPLGGSSSSTVPGGSSSVGENSGGSSSPIGPTGGSSSSGDSTVPNDTGGSNTGGTTDVGSDLSVDPELDPAPSIELGNGDGKGEFGGSGAQF